VLFLVGVLELFLDIVDFKVTEGNRPVLSAVVTFLGILFWYVVLRIVLENLNNIGLVLMYASGCGIGCYVGMKVMYRVKSYDKRGTPRD